MKPVFYVKWCIGERLLYYASIVTVTSLWWLYNKITLKTFLTYQLHWDTQTKTSVIKRLFYIVYQTVNKF